MFRFWLTKSSFWTSRSLLFVSLFWPMIGNVFVAVHKRELSFSPRCSWLKGEPPRTPSQLVATNKKTTSRPLHTQRFWVQAIYTELLLSSRFDTERGKTEKRPIIAHGLVKMLCLFHQAFKSDMTEGLQHGCLWLSVSSGPKMCGRFNVAGWWLHAGAAVMISIQLASRLAWSSRRAIVDA